MGKTAKGKDKTKAKVAKAKAKIARKTKRGEIAAVVAAFALAFLLAGCSTSDSAQPAKSQTQNNQFDDCIIIVAAKVSLPIAGTNETISADGEALPTLELFTQTQSLESTGSTDTFNPTATQTPTTDVKPDVDVTVPVNKAGAAQSVGSTLGDAAASLINGVMNDGKSTGAAATNGTSAATATQ